MGAIDARVADEAARDADITAAVAAGDVTTAVVVGDVATDGVATDGVATDDDDAAEVTAAHTTLLGITSPPRIAPPLMRRTGEHDVIDDGKATMIMDAIDPATLGLDLPIGVEGRPDPALDDRADAGLMAVTDEPSAPVITIEPGSDGEGEGDGDGEDDAPSPGPAEAGASADKPAGRSKRRRKRR
jgi:hypothetical protein